ncbi:MAG: GH3 auxin-responsive promoter family protein [Bacteroidaceae bacterium]|nr:GH3 auxin-responsive promoter family protein [Bacteroidaceae bacterium]
MNITRLVRPIFTPRITKIENYDTAAEEIQMKVLRTLIAAAKDTEWGRQHNFKNVETYEQFVAACPVSDYDALKGFIDRMRHGERNVLWPGRVDWYAKSSGTTSDKSKFIPVSRQGLKDTHYAGGFDSVSLYLHNTPESRLFDGRSLVLGGSHAPNYNVRHSLVGDLSAILIENMNPLVNYVRVPSKKTALLADFEQKRERIAREAMHRDVRSLSGVPSWMLSVLDHMLEISGCETIDELWPRLEVFWHGGVAFTPYREQYRRIIRSSRMHYMETYNASEGFFGIQSDPADKALLLMIDYGVFFEFIPMNELDKEQPTVVPLWGVTPGQNYAMVISTSSGLWRYLIGDTVRFTQTNPYKFIISGRTKCFINAFGEELMMDNAEQGLARACDATGAEVLEYTAAPVFMDAEGHCRHQWLVEFAKEPADKSVFAQMLDKALQDINSDYEAKRFKNITLQPLELITARSGLFNDWLKSRGKLGGQHKVPRLSNDRKIIDELLAMNV